MTVYVDKIVGEHYFTAADGVIGLHSLGDYAQDLDAHLFRVVICVLALESGRCAVGASEMPTDDEPAARKTARANAIAWGRFMAAEHRGRQAARQDPLDRT